MRISLAFHIIGIVMWVGGLLAEASIMKYFESHPELKGVSYKALAKKLFFAFIIPGVLLTALSGLYQISASGISFYMQQGWFHGKLTFLIVLFVVTGIFWYSMKRVQEDEPLPAKRFGMLHGIVGATFLIVVFLTLIGRA